MIAINIIIIIILLRQHSHLLIDSFIKHLLCSVLATMLFAEVVSGILTISIGKEGLSPQVSETHLY